LSQSLKNIPRFFVDEPLLVRRIGSPSKAGFASLLESGKLNDHGEEECVGSGINPGPEPDNGAMEEMVHAVRERVTFFMSYLAIYFQSGVRLLPNSRYLLH